MFRSLFKFVLIVFLLALLVAPVMAQNDNPPNVEVTLEATTAPMEVTVEPGTSVVYIEVPDEVRGIPQGIIQAVSTIIIVIVVAVAMAFQTRSNKPLIEGYKEIARDRVVLEQGHQKYLQSSLTVQQLIQLLHSGFVFVGARDIPGIDEIVDVTEDALEDIIKGTDLSAQAPPRRVVVRRGTAGTTSFPPQSEG